MMSGRTSRSRIALTAVASLAACARGAGAFESTLDAVPCAPMPDKVYRLLKEGVEGYQPQDTSQEKKKTESLALLKRWRLNRWPDLTRLTRVRVDLAEKRGEAAPGQINAWQVSDKLLLLDDFTIRPVGRDKVTPLDHAAEVHEMVAYAVARAKVRNVEEGEALRKTPLRFVRGFKVRDSPLYPLCVPLHHAYAAALLGYDVQTGPLLRSVMSPSGGLKWAYDRLARNRMHAAMGAFHRGSPRKELLAALEEAHVLYPESECDWEVMSLIGPLRRELAEGPPAYVRKPPDERTEEEEIRALIYEFREIAGDQGTVPGYPNVFGNWSFAPDVNPAKRLVVYGQKAMPQLIETLDDYTPTRTVGFRWNSRLLRRMDVAMHVIEKIAGCDFYVEASTSGDLHNDKLERRNSAIANVKEWWAASKGKSQADGIHIQLAIWERNTTVRTYERIGTLATLSAIEGPEKLLGEPAKLPGAYAFPWGDREPPPPKAALESIDPRVAILNKFERFWKRNSKHGDFSDIRRYGDKRVYAELTRRFEAMGTLDPASDSDLLEYQLPEVARCGGNWAIPILAMALRRTDMEPRRHADGNVRRRSAADAAAKEFQRLTGRDFGWQKDSPEAERLAAIKKAREWWLGGGRDEMAAAIAADHPPGEGSGDLFMSDDEIAACVAAVGGEDAALRRKTVAGLGQAFDYRVQRALLAALETETEPRERIAILTVLKPHVRPWHLPAVVRLMERDEDASVRAAAAGVVAKLNPRGSRWNLEPCLAAVRSARKLAADAGVPAEVRRAAAEVLMGRDWWGASWVAELPLLSRLAADPAFAGFEKLHKYVRDKEETLERMRAHKETTAGEKAGLDPPAEADSREGEAPAEP